jgi:UDP-N-acetylglucosamine 4-epimerase
MAQDNLTQSTSRESLKKSLGASLGQVQRVWLVTGAAGFIGSHLVERLLKEGQRVVGFDNHSTGRKSNLEEVSRRVGQESWGSFEMIEGDLTDARSIARACEGVDVILHQAALGSVPGSIENPMQTHESNVTGFVNLLEAARALKVKRVVYASSSSVYGDCPDLPLREESAGRIFSPYAASKWINEVYARTYAGCYGMELIGLRYFNVFGPRQDPNGAYAAVIPKWIQSLVAGNQIVINGDGANTRDFCSVADVATANLLAGTAELYQPGAVSLNVGTGLPVSLLQLHEMLVSIAKRRGVLGVEGGSSGQALPVFGPARTGDIVHSTANVTVARETIQFTSSVVLEEALDETFEWFAN